MRYILINMEAIIVRPENKDELKALKDFLKSMKMRFSSEDAEIKRAVHNAEYTAKLKRAQSDLEEGRFRTISLDEIWK